MVCYLLFSSILLAETIERLSDDVIAFMLVSIPFMSDARSTSIPASLSSFATLVTRSKRSDTSPVWFSRVLFYASQVLICADVVDLDRLTAYAQFAR